MRRLTPAGWLGLALVGLAVAVAVVAVVWTPYDPVRANPAAALSGPSAEHLLGTDRFGRDVASRIMAGAQVALLVGAVSVLIAAVVGVPLGTAAGMARASRRTRVLDTVISRASDLLLAFPALLLAIVAGAVWGPSAATATIAIGIAGIPSFARVARSGTIQVMTQDFVAAARVSRVPAPTIAVRHVLPNLTALIIVQATAYFALAILAEAGLSYLGLGTAAPAASWGRMLHDAQPLLATHPLLALWPGGAIAATVLGFNLLGDGLRDAFDPRLSGGTHA